MYPAELLPPLLATTALVLMVYAGWVKRGLERGGCDAMCPRLVWEEHRGLPLRPLACSAVAAHLSPTPLIPSPGVAVGLQADGVR